MNSSSLRHRSMRRQILGLAGLPLYATLSGCSTVTQTWRWMFGPTQLSQIVVIADGDANGDTPVALDVVQVGDESTWQTLSSLKAADWFANRDDWRRQYPQQIGVSSWEAPPGSRVEGKVPPLRDGAVGCLVFANYPGDHPFRLQYRGIRRITVILKKDSIQAFAG